MILRDSGTAGSFLLLVVLVVLILGVPLILITFRIIEEISDKRYEAARRAEEERSAEENSVSDKESPKDAGEWTPAKHMR